MPLSTVAANGTSYTSGVFGNARRLQYSTVFNGVNRGSMRPPSGLIGSVQGLERSRAQAPCDQGMPRKL